MHFSSDGDALRAEFFERDLAGPRCRSARRLICWGRCWVPCDRDLGRIDVPLAGVRRRLAESAGPEMGACATLFGHAGRVPKSATKRRGRFSPLQRNG
jgi:hypothetical protein